MYHPPFGINSKTMEKKITSKDMLVAAGLFVGFAVFCTAMWYGLAKLMWLCAALGFDM